MPSRTLLARAVALLVALTLSVGLTTADARATTERKPADPRRTHGLFVDKLMPAARQEAVYRSRIGRVPQAFWVIPEAYPTATVRAKVVGYTHRALKARKTPVVVVYGIPGRDCGQYSSNNPLRTAAQYRAWINRIAAGLRKQRALVVLEPDALPLFSSTVAACPTKPAGWTQMLRYASKRLSKSGAWVYLDAGHSDWRPYDTRPAYLKAAGVAYTRGISTNVSNFRPTADEQRYAATLLRGLRRLGVKGKHYVVDTSRNGYARPVARDVINPTWARVGRRPRLVFRGAFDGTLWVKHPGESDGTVNGGPASGQWCDLLADRLLGRTGTGAC